jgi:glucose/arabinose dehydrogenase/mono/diheme cytochrome c family protein
LSTGSFKALFDSGGNKTFTYPYTAGWTDPEIQLRFGPHPINMRAVLNLPVILLFAIFLASCNPKPTTNELGLAADSVAIGLGKVAFEENCSACHNFKTDGIGPQLAGVTGRPLDWIRDFIKSPQAMIDSGDSRALAMLERYSAVMPSFGHLPPEQIDNIISYMHTQKSTARRRPKIEDPNALKDPITDSIRMSGLTVQLEYVAQIPASSEAQPFTRIAKLDYIPGSTDILVLDLRGKLFRINNGTPEVFMDMQQLRADFINTPGLATGFGSFAFHPDFLKNGLVYTSHSEGPETAPADFAYADSIQVTLQWVLTEWKAINPNAATFAGEGRELLRINMVTGIHGMQEVGFNPTAKRGSKDHGMLYAGIGDGGSVEAGHLLPHDKSRLWGTIIRIDPAGRNSTNGKYGVPDSNPFENEPGSRGEIYSMGFRNPHRFTWTRSGMMIATNIGQHHIESLNIIEPATDFGWPLREGSFVLDYLGDMHNLYPLDANDAESKITYPAAQYDHSEGAAISGGYEYTGSDNSLVGKYFFGDIVNGRLFYVETNELKQGNQAVIHEFAIALNGKATTMKELCGNDRVNLRLGKDAKGELYVFSKADGKIYRFHSAIVF